ncbi:hypothetical protein BX666DRAFT_2022062 [Dichotomocladium elegans]|nr:hypothetical protein BX666DRAFT_2022062 [Dichotomocladium elegans]
MNAGRIDVRVHFGNATQSQARELFQKFYPRLEPDASDTLSAAFADQIPELEFSMAHVQGFLMGHKNDPEGAAKQVSQWVKRHKQNASRGGANHDTSTTAANTTTDNAAATAQVTTTASVIEKYHNDEEHIKDIH